MSSSQIDLFDQCLWGTLNLGVIWFVQKGKKVKFCNYSFFSLFTLLSGWSGSITYERTLAFYIDKVFSLSFYAKFHLSIYSRDFIPEMAINTLCRKEL